MFIQNTSLLSQLSSLQRNYQWDVILPNVQGTDGNNWIGTEISPFIQSVSFGEYSMDDVSPIRHGALKAHSAGVFSIQSVSMEFLTDTTGLVLGYFESWRSLIYDSTNLFYYPKVNYVNGGQGNPPCIITFYDTEGNSVYQWTLGNIFPKSFPSFKLNYENEIMKFPIEFSVDFITPNSQPSN